MSSPAEIAAGTAVELFLLALAVGLLYRVWGRFLPVPQKQRVLAFQRGVVLLGESVEKVLGPGSYWITPKRTLLICDMRPKPFQVQSQELLTSDGMGIRVSLGGEYRITAPALFTAENSDAFGAFYLELRQALRVSAGEGYRRIPPRKQLVTHRPHKGAARSPGCPSRARNDTARCLGDRAGWLVTGRLSCSSTLGIDALFWDTRLKLYGDLSSDDVSLDSVAWLQDQVIPIGSLLEIKA